MEYIEGYSLLHYIPKNGLSESVGSVLFSQLCRAVAYCHSQNVSLSLFLSFFLFLNLFLSLTHTKVIHGDINLKNILIRHSDRTLKLIDFGSSHIVNDNEREEERPLRPDRGNILYFPPSDERLSYAWDSWSCGVVLYAMMMNGYPFKEDELITGDLKLYIPVDKCDGKGAFFHLTFSDISSLKIFSMSLSVFLNSPL